MVSTQVAGDIPQCSVCGLYMYSFPHYCQSRTYRVEWLTGTVDIKPPRYKVTRTRILVGRWPFRREEWEYRAACDFSTMTMSAEAYCWFKAQFWQQIVEAWDD